jgi:hypothetical protein
MAEIAHVPPPRLDLGDGRGPIVVAVDPINGAGERAIMAHIAYLEHQVAL